MFPGIIQVTRAEFRDTEGIQWGHGRDTMRIYCGGGGTVGYSQEAEAVTRGGGVRKRRWEEKEEKGEGKVIMMSRWWEEEDEGGDGGRRSQQGGISGGTARIKCGGGDGGCGVSGGGGGGGGRSGGGCFCYGSGGCDGAGGGCGSGGVFWAKRIDLTLLGFSLGTYLMVYGSLKVVCLEKPGYQPVVMNQGSYFSTERHSIRVGHLQRLERHMKKTMMEANSVMTPTASSQRKRETKRTPHNPENGTLQHTGNQRLT